MFMDLLKNSLDLVLYCTFYCFFFFFAVTAQVCGIIFPSFLNAFFMLLTFKLEIKMLKISNKKISLAPFLQLPKITIAPKGHIRHSKRGHWRRRRRFFFLPKKKVKVLANVYKIGTLFLGQRLLCREFVTLASAHVQFFSKSSESWIFTFTQRERGDCFRCISASREKFPPPTNGNGKAHFSFWRAGIPFRSQARSFCWRRTRQT